MDNNNELFDARSRLKEIREDQRLTLREMAERLEMSVRGLQYLEAHARSLPSNNLIHVFRKLNITPNQFFGWDPLPYLSKKGQTEEPQTNVHPCSIESNVQKKELIKMRKLLAEKIAIIDTMLIENRQDLTEAILHDLKHTKDM